MGIKEWKEGKDDSGLLDSTLLLFSGSLLGPLLTFDQGITPYFFKDTYFIEKAFGVVVGNPDGDNWKYYAIVHCAIYAAWLVVAIIAGWFCQALDNSHQGPKMIKTRVHRTCAGILWPISVPFFIICFIMFSIGARA